MKENDTVQNTPYPIDQLAAGLLKAREARQLTLKSCSEQLGIPVSRLRNYEEGKYTPSLPEIETLAFIYGLPLSALFEPDEIDHHVREPDADLLQQLMRIRGHIISTNLRMAFEKSGKSLRELNKETGLAISKVKKYLTNALEIPYDGLCALSAELGVDTLSLFDNESSMGQWHVMQERVSRFRMLPEDIQKEVIAEGRTELLRAANRLKDLDHHSLRALSEALQTILNMRGSPENDQPEN